MHFLVILIPSDFFFFFCRRYHHFEDMEEYMKKLARRFPDLTNLYSIGKSIQGRKLFVMEITDNPGVHEPG